MRTLPYKRMTKKQAMQSALQTALWTLSRESISQGERYAAVSRALACLDEAGIQYLNMRNGAISIVD